MIRTNEKISSHEVRVIDENGENLGVLATPEALKIARERGLDLLEVGPNIKPPVAKIMNYDKFRYAEEKKQKKMRAQQKTQELKRVQISARAAEHDLQVKVRKAEEFLSKGHIVEIHLRMRGREKANKDWARQKLMDFLNLIKTEYKVIFYPKYSFRGFTMQITKK